MSGPDRLVFKVFSVYNIVTPEGIWSSTDGISWTKTTTEPIGSKLSYTSTTGKVVIVSSRGTWYSTDGTNWALFKLSSPEAVLFANDIWIAAGKSGIYRSINGISWMPVSGTNIPLYYDDYNNEIFINYVSGNNWFIVAERGIWHTSNNGASWTFDNSFGTLVNVVVQ